MSSPEAQAGQSVEVDEWGMPVGHDYYAEMDREFAAQGAAYEEPQEPDELADREREWPSDADLDALIEAAAHTKSGALRFDPEVTGGFRALTADEDRELIDAIRLPEQRYGEDREHLTQERDEAHRAGDRDGIGTAEAHLEVIDDEQRRNQRYDPALPSREQLDSVDVPELSELEARAWEYLDARRDLADEREQADAEGDAERAGNLDAERVVLDRNYLAVVEVDDEERER